MKTDKTANAVWF